MNTLFIYKDPAGKLPTTVVGFPKDAITVILHGNNCSHCFIGCRDAGTIENINKEMAYPRTQKLSMFMRLLFCRWFKVNISPNATIHEAIETIRETWDTARYRDGYYAKAITNKSALAYETEKIDANATAQPAEPAVTQPAVTQPAVTQPAVTVTPAPTPAAEHDDTDDDLPLDDDTTVEVRITPADIRIVPALDLLEFEEGPTGPRPPQATPTNPPDQGGRPRRTINIIP